MEPRFVNLDAAESAFFSRQLEKIRSKVYSTLYPELIARSLVPPPADPAQDGDELVTYRLEDEYGEAKLLNKAGSDDVPLVGVSGQEFTSPIRDYGVGYKVTIGEVRKAARLGMDLSSSLAEKARRASERKLDQVLALGDSDAKLQGLLNHSAITPTDVATRGGNVLWSAKNPDQVLADLNEPAITMMDATKGAFGGGGLTMLLPVEKHAFLSTTRMTDSSESILSYFLRSQSYVSEVRAWWKLKNQGDGGAKDRMVVYKKDPDVLSAEIPAEFEFLDPQPRGFSFYVPGRLSTGGVILTQPKAVIYRDGF